MKKYIAAALTSTLVLAGACSDNPASPSRDRVVAGTEQPLQALLTGIVQSDRSNRSGTNAAIMARDAIVPNANEQRTLTEFYVTPPDPSDFIGSSSWAGMYAQLRATKDLLKSAGFKALSTTDQAATRGFVNTLGASEYIRLIELRDENGVVIQGDSSSVTDPIRKKASVLAYTSALLDSAYTDLKAASASVPFILPSGYQLHGDYTQTANLIKLNRGLKGKVEVMRALDPVTPVAGSAAAAVTALNIALADAPATIDQDYLNMGPWYQYQPSAPESSFNPLQGSTNYVTQNFVDSINPHDARAALIIPAKKTTVAGYSAQWRLSYTDPSNASLQSSPVPMVRNAEFFLLRAQAEIATNDLVGATRDINAVHTVEGGLPAYTTFTSAASAIAAVLYEYRYSFAYFGAQHLVALREYKMMTDTYLKQPGMPAYQVIVDKLPIPLAEMNARGGNITPVAYP
jgi:starch-binding outer membrane protein, SusD/RagB family